MLLNTGKTMKLFTKTIIIALSGLTLMSTIPAQAQIESVADILEKVRENSAQTEAENRQREAVFRQRRDQQQQLLRRARNDLAALERRARQLQAQFDENQNTITRLNAELSTAQGEFRDVFGLARSQAAEFKALLDNSLITAEDPFRTEVLGRVAESKTLPDATELNSIWQSMLYEIQAQRQIKTFNAPVANAEDGAPQSVVRVGPFTVFTKAKGQFLDYKKPEGNNRTLLAQLPRQPQGEFNSAANKVARSNGGLVYAPIDPTRGNLLRSFELVPDVFERISQGGIIGYFILSLAGIGCLFGIIRILMLVLISSTVNAQKRQAHPSQGNPLGRVMMAYDDAKNKDPETVELKLDEAILRESPRLEVGLSLLKLGAGIAPLLGLLGTVTGMIKTFQAMTIHGTGDPQLMAGGISEALVTTMLGLIAAIPLLILHSFCSSLVRGVQGTLEEQAAGIVARHVESQVS